MDRTIEQYVEDAWALLQRLIAVPSISREESAAADVIEETLRSYGFAPARINNNVWVTTALDPAKPTLLLNAHIDTVKPVASWQRDPFTPTIEGDRLYGLGSNDCGGGLVTLMQVIRLYRELAEPTPYSIVILASAEEVVSGKNGIEAALPLLPTVDVAIVGEPTAMEPAIAEKGLMVLDITARGKSGHAARGEGVNAIYELLPDLNWLRNFRFEKVSPLLGETLMQVTQIAAGTQHNVVPDECKIVVDVRTNELYDNQEVYDIVCKHCFNEVKARSFRLRSSHIDESHPLVKRCKELGLTPFGSPTLSDQALMAFPSLKLGPGHSSRSHSADEFICKTEIANAMFIYCQLLKK